MDFTEHDKAIASILPLLEKYQNDYIKTNVVYCKERDAEKLTTTADKFPFTVEVNEYVAPNGKGWRAIFRDGDYVKSVGYGVEAKDCTFDWQPIPSHG